MDETDLIFMSSSRKSGAPSLEAPPDEGPPMRRFLIPAAAVLAFASLNVMAATPATSAAAPATKAVPTASTAAPAAKTAASVRCRDAKGHFTACAKTAAPQHCRDAKGKFVACPK